MDNINSQVAKQAAEVSADAAKISAQAAKAAALEEMQAVKSNACQQKQNVADKIGDIKDQAADKIGDLKDQAADKSVISKTRPPTRSTISRSRQRIRITGFRQNRRSQRSGCRQDLRIYRQAEGYGSRRTRIRRQRSPQSGFKTQRLTFIHKSRSRPVQSIGRDFSSTPVSRSLPAGCIPIPLKKLSTKTAKFSTSCRKVDFDLARLFTTFVASKRSISQRDHASHRFSFKKSL